jgi:hypothetical protein
VDLIERLICFDEGEARWICLVWGGGKISFQNR